MLISWSDIVFVLYFSFLEAVDVLCFLQGEASQRQTFGKPCALAVRGIIQGCGQYHPIH